jgi:protoporphyrinogen oxidase
MGYWYKGELQPWGNPLALLKFRGLSLVAKFRYGLHAFLCTRRTDWRSLDEVNASTWIKGWVGTEAWNILWKKLFELKFYDYADDLSAAWIWSRIRRIGRSRYNLFREKLGHLDGGSTTLLNALRKDIESHGGEIRLASPVQKVVLDREKVTGVEIGGQFIAFDKVISTVPLPYVPRLIPDLPSDILARFTSIRNIAVVCVIAKLKCSLSENFWINVNDPAMDIPGLVEYSNLRKLEDHIVYVPFYMPGERPEYADPDEIFISKVWRYLKTINPALADSDLIDIRASRYRFAQPVCEPGFSRKLPPAALPVGGLWVADTSYYYPEDRGISESIEFGRDMAREAANC